MRHTAKSYGFGLIELLIALVIISLGLLGLAALQVSSLQKTQQTRGYEQASSALQDLVERIGANATAAKNGDFDFSNLNSADNTLPSAADCTSVNCSQSEMARYILRNWALPLPAALPSPRFSVEKTTIASGAMMTLTLTWDASLSGQGAASCAASTVDSAQCSKVTIWLN